MDATQPRLTILLVGYGWFAGIPQGQINNAQLIAEALDGRVLTVRDAAGIRATARVHSLTVPVTWEGAFPPVEAKVEALAPQIVLALGTAAGLEALRPEPYGVNWMTGKDADSPDRACAKEEPIEPGAPAYVRGSLPYERMVLAMLEAGIPAYLGALSDAPDAPCLHRCTTGAYLCNYMAYRLTRSVQARGADAMAGFMHVPTQPRYCVADRLRQLREAQSEADRTEKLAAPLYSTMTLEAMIAGTEAALCACIEAWLDHHPEADR